MDPQADGKIGFIYEETLTNWGKRNNPVSTSFPTGAGQHNFDGFDNIYLAMDVEYITNGAYKLKLDVDRKAFPRISSIHFLKRINLKINEMEWHLPLPIYSRYGMKNIL